MKRLVFCFDGTWNKLNAAYPTNVVLLAESVVPTCRDGTTQIVYYDEGVGTGRWDRFRGGTFGIGLVDNLREAYRFLIFNHEPGDEVFIFGFSRGAFTARSFAGFLRHVGILDVDNASMIDMALELYVSALEKDGDDHPTALHFRAKNSSRVCVSEYDSDWRCENIDGYQKGDSSLLNIKYVGVWDTVGALGLPNVLPFADWLNRRKGFHDVKLTSKVVAARHALAIDERRKLFRPTIWGNINELNSRRGYSSFDSDAPYQQRWFPGVHGAVGGGGRERGLSDSAFSWILVGARREGLQINVSETSRVYEVKPDPYSPLQNDPDRPWHDVGFIGWIKHWLLSADREGPNDIKDVSAFARKRWNSKSSELPEGKEYRPKTLNLVKEQLDKFKVTCAELDSHEIEVKFQRAYDVVSGDDLPKIAEHFLGSPDVAARIFEINEDLIDDPREIHIGWKLRLPTPE